MGGQTTYVYCKEASEKPTSSKAYSGPYLEPTVEDFNQIISEYKNKSYYDILVDALKTHSSRPCIGVRQQLADGTFSKDFTFSTFRQIHTEALKLYHAIIQNDLVQENKFDEEPDQIYRNIGIFAPNSEEWMVTDLACMLSNLTSVTFYATLGDSSFDYIANLTQVSSLFISPDNIGKFIKYNTEFKLPITTLIIYDKTAQPSSEQLDNLKAKDIKYLLYTEMIKSVDNETLKKLLPVPGPDHIFSLCFTSGTTGEPKGVKLTHRMMACQVEGVKTKCQLSKDDVHLSFLPLAHVMERVLYSLVLTAGGAIGLAAGDLRVSLVENVGLLRPTFMVAVPKLLSRFRETIFGKFKEATGMKKWLLDSALETKMKNMEQDLDYSHWFYDSLVFKKSKTCSEEEFAFSSLDPPLCLKN